MIKCRIRLARISGGSRYSAANHARGARMYKNVPLLGSHDLHRAAVFTIWPEMPANADPTRHRIWAYCDALSYAPGDLVRVHVHCSAATFDLEVTRDSAVPQIVLSKEGLRGAEPETPAHCSVKGCNWPVALEFRVPEDWRSAAYRLTTRVAASGNERANEHHHLFIVRPPLSASQVVARSAFAAGRSNRQLDGLQ
jgi:hypothetical protein